MDILLISEYILIIALIIMLIAAVRAGAYRSNSMGLLGTSVATVVLAMILLVIGVLNNLEFYKDISLALIFFGFVGTVAFASVLGGSDS